jgi:uncharacterized protein
MELRGTWVWVTGASSGLGLEMAKQLARDHGAHLILTARRADRLEALKTELEAAHGVKVRALVGDMSKTDDVTRMLDDVRQVDGLSAVVLNAGITHFGPHDELTWPAFEQMLNTNLIGTARLTTELVRHFKARPSPARVMLVTSMAGLSPVPFQSAYSGTKAFLTSFGTALAHELKGTHVSVTVFAPAGIKTEMTSGERFGPLSGWLAPVDAVAGEAVTALRDGPVLAVPGFINRLGLFAFRFLPRNVVMASVSSQYRKALALTTKR